MRRYNTVEPFLFHDGNSGPNMYTFQCYMDSKWFFSDSRKLRVIIIQRPVLGIDRQTTQLDRAPQDVDVLTILDL